MARRGKVYLAGPMTGLTYEQCVEWRDIAKKKLGELGIDAYSPLRFKEYLRDEGELTPFEYNHPLSTTKGLTRRDRFDCKTSDIILVNFLNAKIVSVGTCIELGWGDAYGKPLVVIMDKDNKHRHAMVEEVSGYIVETLEEGIELVKALLLP